MNKSTPLVIISPDVSGLSDTELASRRAFLRTQLNREELAFVPAQGVYKGQKEYSYIVPLRDYNRDLSKLLRLARAYDQETVLVVDANRHAALHTPDNDITPLGKFRKVTEAAAKKEDGYTLVDGEYWVAG